MFPSILTSAKPGSWGRVSFRDAANGQPRKLGGYTWYAMPAEGPALWAEALRQQQASPDREIWVDVLPRQAGRRNKPLITIKVNHYSGLGAAPADTPTTDAPMSDQLFTPMAPGFSMMPASMPGAAMSVQQVQQPMLPSIEAPASMPELSKFIYQQQGQHLQQAVMRTYELQQIVVGKDMELAELKRKLDEANFELRHKDREHKADLEEARRNIRNELEESMTPNKPKGLGGLADVMTNPEHPMAGLVGLLANKLLGASPTGAAAPAADGTMGGHSKNMTDILNGIAELIPNDEYGVHLYLALQKLLAQPTGLDQLQALAAQAAPELA